MSEAKKRKQEEELNKVEEDEKALEVLQRFKLVKVLREDAAKKFVVVEGRVELNGKKQFNDDDNNEEKEEAKEKEEPEKDGKVNKAVLLLEKKPIVIDEIEDFVNTGKAKLTFVNDCYSNYQLASSDPKYDVKVTLINPATEKHITKYSEQERFVIHETAEIYKTVTLPVMEKQSFAVEWVYNILEKKAEVDKVVFEDPDPENGFVLLPDMKWNGTELESLYLVAIAHTRDIKSLRDLNQSHLPLLKNILKQCPALISKKYGVAPCKLRLYCHYEPSYYHFHVHINHIKLDCPGKEILRAHLLSDIIDNIEIKNNYYQEKTLSFLVAENSLLYKELDIAGHLDRGAILDSETG